MEILNMIMMFFGYFVAIVIFIILFCVSLILFLLKAEEWNIFNPKQKFSLFPKIVWNTKCKEYHQSLIWLCWYWDNGEQPYGAKYYRLTDKNECAMQWHRFTRTITNTW